jgi:2-oxo-4-hydroxy-4-carboxy-5-ureidoimidazoline decarboxylase
MKFIASLRTLLVLAGSFVIFSSSSSLPFASLGTNMAAAQTCSPSETCADDAPPPSVQELLAKPKSDIVDALAGIYEHSAWVAESFVKGQYSKISTVTELANQLKAIVDAASREQKMALLNAHPDLCEKVEKMKELTAESQEEQSKAGLQSMEGEELANFKKLNDEYKGKFGFPFILAVRNASKNTVLSALEGRLPNPPQDEFVTAIQQVHKIAWMRLLSKINTEDAQGFLTCHVLDTANGIPAAKMKIMLTRLTPKETAGFVGEFVTNEDGRLEGGPALKGGKEFTVGTYEWTFYAGDYFASKGTFTSGTPFLDVIPLRFGIDNPDDHYHVPLLVSPWSFSTYRGS